jgi:stage II sporulation protein D
MKKRLCLLIILSFSFSLFSYPSTVRVRLFTEKDPTHVFFRVVSGNYSLRCPGIKSADLSTGDEIILSRYKNFVAIKLRGFPAFSSDSVIIESSSESPGFFLRTGALSGIYSGGLTCYPDLAGLVIVNSCELEEYIAGVVRAEGGSGKNIGFFRTQAVIARTYTYKYFDKHAGDKYNLCDDTHCQAFAGITGDTIIGRAVKETSGLVIAGSDSSLILSAFHSNCGGETSPSEYVWLSPQPYLVKVPDPFCAKSGNAIWEKMIGAGKWYQVLKKNNFAGPAGDASAFAFSQPERVADYKIEGFSLPLKVLRDELGLRSTWFTVIPEGDSLYLRGKGYGHGIGLCQEGAMVMAKEGSGFEEIIRFYYPGVRIMDIRFTKKNSNGISRAGK